jgi:hypothetical protein
VTQRTKPADDAALINSLNNLAHDALARGCKELADVYFKQAIIIGRATYRRENGNG